jgi:hypothetical protein
MWTITTSTIITKFMTTTTCHSTATCCSFNPIVTSRTLFEFCPSNEIFELFIVLTVTVIYPVLCTGHSMMIVASACKTVVLVTNWTTIVIKCTLITKNCSAARSWTPGCILLVLLDEHIQAELFVLFLGFAVHALVYQIN